MTDPRKPVRDDAAGPGPGNARESRSLPYRTRYALVLAVFGTGAVYLDQSAVTIALPAIQRELGLALDDLQWTVSIYYLFMSAPLLLCGIVGDRLGRVRLYAVGMSLFGGAGLFCGLAPDIVMLLTARAVQGLGAAMMISVGLAILTANTPVDARARVIGTWAALTSLVISVGPALGGWVVDTLSWRAVFVINAPVAVAAVLIARTRVPESSIDRSARLDAASVLLLLGGMGAVLFSLIEGPRWNWALPPIAGAGAGIAMLVCFAWRQRVAAHPLLPAHLFRYRRFRIINLLTVLQWLAISAVFFFLPLNLQQVQDFDATSAGLAMLPVSLAVVVFSRLSGRVADRTGPVAPMLTGIAAIGAALWLLGSIREIDRISMDLLPAVLLFGFGLGMLVAPLTHVAMNSLPDHHAGLASGVNNTASRISNMLAVALFGGLMSMWFGHSLEAHLEVSSLSRAAQVELYTARFDLGAARLPPSFAAGEAASARNAVKQSFFDAWSRLMKLAAVVCAASLLLAFAGLRKSGPLGADTALSDRPGAGRVKGQIQQGDPE